MTVIRRQAAAALHGGDRRWATGPVSEGAEERLLLCVEELVSNASGTDGSRYTSI
ncbi:hypothetical protein [Geodermatophilus maliterrae]|uniref:Uncharacterized protein n=1 Tax=Geodermatophilus maliterrae TaxID=3162531 RepID=A0ABV3XE56_9ACTN